MPKLTDQQDADGQHDPYSNPAARDLLRQEGEAGQDTGLGSDADSSKKSTTDPANTASNIHAANAAEQSAPDVPNQYNWDNSTKGDSPKKNVRARLRGFVRKRGSLFIIGGGFLGAGTLVTMFFSPALLLVQMSEVLNERFNDQLAALDARSTLIMKKKLNSQTTKGFCGTKVTIKCKYRTISKNQTKRLTAAGLVPMNGQDVIEGRGKPTKFNFNGKEISASQLLNEARRDPALRSALRKGYNPSFAAWADANAFKLLGRFGIKKSSSVDPSSDKEKMRQQLTDTAQGKVDGVGTTKLQGYDKDGNPVNDVDATYFESTEGVRYDDADEGRRVNTLIQESIDRGGLADGIGKSVLKSGVKSVLTSTALGAGAVDTLCTAWTLIRVAGYAAKVYQQRQLIRYSYEFQKQADMIRAGDGKAELSSFFSDIVTKPNKEGKAATDSAGYRWAAYGDVFKPTDFNITQAKYSEDDAEEQADKIELQNETSRYINGQLVSTSLMASLASKVSEGGDSVAGADSTCKFVKSWKGQALIIGAALAGAFVAFFSGGTSIGLGAVLNGAAGVTLSVVFALLQPKLIDMAKGEVIKGDENGNEAGNAMVSGAGALNAQASQTRGLPVQTKEDYVTYSELSKQVAADYNEVDRFERSPFDPTSKNTFIGSIVSSLVPYVMNSNSVGAGLLNTGSLVASTTSSLISPQVSAEETTLQAVDQCEDYEYDKEKLAADPFCNLRYGMSQQDLAIDPEEVVDYMLENCDGGCIVSDEDPTAKSGSEYENYIKVCIERETSIGDEFTGLDGTGEGGDAGEMCIDGNSGTDEKKHTMFRLMYIDSTVDEGMETDYAIASPATGEGIEFTVASYNILHADHHTDDSIRIGGCNTNPVAGDQNCAKTRTARQVEIINGGAGNPVFDIVATQETSPQQFGLLKQSLSNYDSFPNDGSRLSNNQDGAVAMFWNRQKFTKFAEGKMPAISNTSLPITNPWVGLQATGGQKVYVTSIHYAVSGFGGTPESIKKSSELTTDWVKEKVSDGSTVIVAGDFNDKPSQKISYCVYTKDGLMAHAQNIKDGKMSDPDCNSLPSYNGIDHVYATPNNGLTALAWQNMPKEGLVKNASDHSPAYATFAFPGAPSAGGTEPVPYKNSVYNKSAPDPSVIRGDDGVYHVYATGGSGDNPFIHLSSTDLVNWKPAGRTLNNPPAWVKTGLHWAPDVTKVGSQYILSFTSGTDSSRKIGYAVSTSAAGPFSYKGMLVEPGEFPRPDGRGTIDSHIFVDGGQPYLFYGGGIISVVKLSISADGTITKEKSSRKELLSKNSVGTIEGTWVHKRGNYYYLFYSFGDYNQRSGAAEYSTRIARSTSVMGPYEPATPYKALLQGKDPFRGPGHNSVATDNAGNDWIVYHALNGRNDRVLMIDPITYSGDGWPMVNDGYPSSQKVVAGPALGGSAAGGSVASGGIAWPIDKKWFDTNRADILNAHNGAGTFTSPGTNGIAADIGLPGGTPIYALVAGTITKKPLGRSSRICAGVPNGNDNGGLQISSDIQGGKLEVAYAHGTNVIAGPTVRAGQKIMDAGQVGNSCGVHLHIDMSFNGKNLCPQDVFLALSKNQTPNFAELANKAGGSCGR